MKTVQIPVDLFDNLCLYFSEDFRQLTSEEQHKLHNSVVTGLITKADAMNRREAYTKYKTAEPGQSREFYREVYLDMAGIHKDWRSDIEEPNP